MFKKLAFILLALIIVAVMLNAQEVSPSLAKMHTGNISPNLQPAAYAVVEGVHVLDEPLINADLVSALRQYQGMMLDGRSADGDWIHVSLPQVGAGWVDAHYIRANVSFDLLPVVD